MPLYLARPLSDLAQCGLDLLFPPVCVGCRRPGSLLCPACAQSVEPMGDTICQRCGRRQPQPVPACPLCREEAHTVITLARAAALHTHPLRTAIHHLKYEGRAELASILGRYLVAAFAEPVWSGLPAPIAAVVPVPLHAARRAERGYNQAELLAQTLCQCTGLPLRPAWIERRRQTRQQVGLNAIERRENVAQAFSAQPAVAGLALLLVDDVYTTGATLSACAAAALAAGAAAVYALTLAAPDRPQNVR